MSETTLYCIGGVEKTHKIQFLNQQKDLLLSWAKGMVGVLPVFNNLKDAIEYVGDSDLEIYSIKVEK